MQCQSLLNLSQLSSQSEVLLQEVVKNGHDNEKGKIMINNSQLGNRSITILINIIPLLEIKQLLLWDNMIGDKGVSMLSKVRWPNLRSLRLAQNIITKSGIKSLTNGNFSSICELSLYRNPIGNEGVKQLIKGEWKNLSVILLNDCQISNEGTVFLTFGNWMSLKSLNLGSNLISQAGSLSLCNVNKQQNTNLCVMLFSNKFRPSISKLLRGTAAQKWRISV